MSTNNSLLVKLSQRLNGQSTAESRLAAVTNRLESHPGNTIPQRGLVGHDQLVDLFEKMLMSVQGTVARVAKPDAVPLAIQEYLALHALGDSVFIDDELSEMDIDWTLAPALKYLQWREYSSMSVGVTTCFGAVAETGSLVVCSSSTHAITMNFLSETNIVILEASGIVGVYEEIWSALRARKGHFMPRDLTLISSPSCTGDIELVLEYGAHGPKRLHVIIVEAGSV